MGALWSKKKELEKLEKSITSLDTRRKTSEVNSKKFIAYLVYIAIFSELILASWYYFHKKPSALVDRIKDFSPLLVPPVCGYLLSYTIAHLYKRRIKSDEVQLAKQRSQLKLKLEARKKATEFEATQQLLSKYENLTKSEDSPKQTRKGQQPQNPNQQNSGPNQNQQNQNPNQQNQQKPQQPGGVAGAPTSPAHPTGKPPPDQVGPVGPVGPGGPGQVPRGPTTPKSKSWMDKLVDYVVGGEPQHSFALICSNCRGHNGLVPQSEMQAIQFRCRMCNHFNQAQPPSSASTSSSSSSSSPNTNSVKTQKAE